MYDLSHLSPFDYNSLAGRRGNEIQTADELLGYKDGKTPVQRTHVLNRRPRVYGIQPAACDADERCGSYTVPYKTPREYDPETIREEISWTEVPILAGYRRGLTQ